MGMAKSGDDLMRWQKFRNIARAECGGAAGRKHTLSINRRCWVFPALLEITPGNSEITSGMILNGQCFELFGGFGYEWRVGGL